MMKRRIGSFLGLKGLESWGGVSEMRLRTMFVLFDMFYMFVILVSETPHKLPELRGIAIQKASYLSEF